MKCERCKGSGWLPSVNVHDPVNGSVIGILAWRCPECNGTGEAPAPPAGGPESPKGSTDQGVEEIIRQAVEVVTDEDHCGNAQYERCHLFQATREAIRLYAEKKLTCPFCECGPDCSPRYICEGCYHDAIHEKEQEIEKLRKKADTYETDWRKSKWEFAESILKIRKEIDVLKKTLVEVAIPLEVLAVQIKVIPYTELSKDLQDTITKAVKKIHIVLGLTT